jgi:hypothetical protein
MESVKIGIREFRENLAGYLESDKPLAITRHGETLGLDVLQLSGLLAGDVKESRNDSPTRDLQMAADRTWPHTLCGPVVSSLFSFAARC